MNHTTIFKKSLLAVASGIILIAGCAKKDAGFDANEDKSMFKTLGKAQQPQLKGQNHLTKGVDKYKLLVKFNRDVILDFDDAGKPIFRNERIADFTLTENTKKRLESFHYRQAIPFSKQDKALMRQGAAIPFERGGFDINNFKGLAYIKEAETMSPQSVLELAKELEQFDFIDYAEVEADIIIPPPATPDFFSYQTYTYLNVPNSSNQHGLNIEYAWWTAGITGVGVRVADIEYNYNPQHEDLVSPRAKYIVGSPSSSYQDHGTAVAGIMIAKYNNWGMNGMVANIDSFFFVQETVYGRAAGIAAALPRLRSGDVFLYEMQTTGPNGQYAPPDYSQSVWDVTLQATNAGVIIVSAAGNGSQNLDAPEYAAYRNRGDNGAILVGAGNKSQVRASFSNYGSRVNLQAWGDWSVATTGYGSLYNGGANATYSNDFSGTSSATPLVASAVVAVQSWHKQNKGGAVLSPVKMRQLLIQTGSPQSGSGNIGPIPNVGAAIQQLN